MNNYELLDEFERDLRREERNKSIALGTYQFIAGAFFWFAVVAAIGWCWPGSIPFDLYQFWVWNTDSILSSLISCWPLFVWGALTTAVIHYLREPSIEEHDRTIYDVVSISVRAGVLEEIVYRWLLFYFYTVSVVVSGWLFFGWLFDGFEIARLFHIWINVPILNLLSWGHLNWLLVDKGWAVGAAAVLANVRFREAHAGPLVSANAWMLGFVFFWIMFEHGLPAAILVHIVYDLVVFGLSHAIVRYQIARGQEPPREILITVGRDPSPVLSRRQ